MIIAKETRSISYPTSASGIIIKYHWIRINDSSKTEDSVFCFAIAPYLWAFTEFKLPSVV